MKTSYDKYDVLFSSESFLVPASGSSRTAEENEKLDSIVSIELKISPVPPSNYYSGAVQLHSFHIPKKIAIQAGIWDEKQDQPICKDEPEDTEHLLTLILQQLGVQFED